ncbi:MAG: DUF3047 domain-containing protein, partial [Rhodothermales bacterium]|nr:DUF3047 domain-containing protein [Rhodothermales bacterium]
YGTLSQTDAHSQLECRPGVKCLVVDDFESYEQDGLPLNWSTYQKQGEVYPVTGKFMNDKERFVIKEEGGNKFVRAIINDEAHRLIMANDDRFEWRFEEYPILTWKWRANQLPEGAREDKLKRNDTGAAVYVVFGKDWLGRPKSIKYTYSSSLPAGTVVSNKRLKVLVLASEPEDGTGRWITHERNIAEDYRMLFGKKPPKKPVGIMLWSDSDTIDSFAEVDFDDVALMSQHGGTNGSR